MKRMVIAALLFWASSVYSEYDRHIESLKGMEEIAVFIEFLDEIKQSGLTDRKSITIRCGADTKKSWRQNTEQGRNCTDSGCAGSKGAYLELVLT